MCGVGVPNNKCCVVSSKLGLRLVDQWQREFRFWTVIIVGMAFALQFATVSHADDIDHYSDRDRLQTALKTGEPRNFYRHELKNMGWQITPVNYDNPEYVEYEIVKGED